MTGEPEPERLQVGGGEIASLANSRLLSSVGEDEGEPRRRSLPCCAASFQMDEDGKTTASRARSHAATKTNHRKQTREHNLIITTTSQILLVLSSSLLLSSFIIFNLVSSNEATSAASANGNLSPSDRVHIVRKPANSASSTYKQTKQNFKENFDKIVIHVKENTPIGTRLTEVQPRDSNDASPGGVHSVPPGGGGPSAASSGGDKIIYAIVGGADQHAFTLREDPSEGKVELVNEVNFDYESTKTSYSVVIRATSVYFRYELEVDVVVEDENDNKPQLEDFAIVFNNYKNHFPTGPIGRVPATDLDINDALRYRVLSGNTAQLILVNETNGDIQLSPWLNSNVPLRTVMDIAVSDGINEAVAKLVLTVDLITEPMLHNSVVLRLDGITRDDFLSKKYDIFQNQMARILVTSSQYSANNIVVFDVEQSHYQAAATLPPERNNSSPAASLTTANQNLPERNYKTAYNQHATVINASLIYVNVSFSARANGNDVEAYLSRQYIEERIFLNRLHLAQQLDAQVAPFQDDICLQEPCQNYHECQVTYKFDKAPKSFYTNRNMIFRQIKTAQSYACLCPPTFTGMKNKHECNLQINQCFTNPCLNGGQCHRHESGYTCDCGQGEFFGPRCEHNFYNSTCQSIASSPPLALDPSSQSSSSSGLSAYGTVKHSGLIATSSTCSGTSRCVNLNKSHQHYYQKLATASPSLAISSASSGLMGSFSCSSCPHPEQWSTSLCQLRARSFDRQSYIVLPSLRRRHRFHLMLQFTTVQTDALLLYNGRYNDKHDFIALEIVDSRLRFSYSLGQPGQVFAVTLSSVPISDGQWHKVAVDYRDRNVTLIVDDCDPVLDEALARLQSGTPARRCSNTTSFTYGSSSSSSEAYHQMLDLTSPMQIGALAPNLLSGDSYGETRASLEPQLASLANNFAGCLADLYVDHQLVDLGMPLQDFGTQPGCPSTERRAVCQQQTCSGNGATCQEFYGQAKCQCGDDRLGRSCELYLSPERVRKFSGNSYLAFNPVEAQIPSNWHVSLHFRTLNPNGILFKVFLDTEASILLEVMGGGLKLSHRSSSLYLNKLSLDDGEWHFVELSWSSIVSELRTINTTMLQVDYNPNLSVQSNDMGQVSGATMRYVVVGSSTTRNSLAPSTAAAAASSSGTSQFLGASSVGSAQSAAQVNGGSDPDAVGPAVAPDSLSAEFASSTQAPLQSSSAPGDDYAYIYAAGAGLASNPNNSSSQSFVGCVYALNMSALDNTDWWQSPYDERNVERGCPVVDPCETGQCPVNSRCVRRGLNQRKCLCNPGHVGDLCLPVCELAPCQGEHSKCVPQTSAQQMSERNVTLSNSVDHHSPSWGAIGFQPSNQQQLYTCECEPNRSGKNCEHQLIPRCPSNWWDRPPTPVQNSSICGPCNCDESKGFDGDCDKLTGRCFCKPNYYQPPDSDYCLACDCYLVGSLSTSCNQTSGQCKCRPGVVGRRCDTCASPYAEVTLRGCEVIYDACPKTYSDGIWWDKTQPDKWASQQCPASTSTGMATRHCHSTEGWREAKMFNCISNTFTDLYTQFQFLEENKFQMSTNLAMKIASNLRQALNETISSPAMQLYGSDMYISFRLIHHLIQHESRQKGLNLTHRQDRAYIRNIAESVSYILEPNYAANWAEIAKRSPNGGAEHLLRLLDTYGKVLIDSQSDTSTHPFEVATKHLTFGMDAISIDQLYDLSKWTLSNGLSASSSSSSSSSSAGFGSLPALTSSHFPSSPPYATDPFGFGPSVTLTRHNGGGSLAAASDASSSGHFNPDGTSIYLDFSSMRDSSPAVTLPKYDNYPTSSLSTNTDAGLSDSQARVFIPLKTLRMRTPREVIGGGQGASGWAAARSRAKRDELLIPDYASMRNQRQPLVVYSIFKSLGPLLPRDSDNTVQNRLGMQAQVSSPVVWLTIRPQNSSDFLQKSLQPKITYMLKLAEPMGKTRPQCAIWDFSSFSASVASSQSAKDLVQGNSSTSAAQQQPLYGLKQTGRFTTRGCELRGVHPNRRLSYKYEYVNCSCDRLGAVIVLMDDGQGQHDYLTNDYDDDSGQLRDLSLISGLCISLVILTASLFVLSCIRGHSIKSNSNSINKNLIVILAIIELLILYSALSRGSLNRSDYQCKLVAIFLHYFSISLFFWLLVNAIHFYRMLTELRDINHGPMKFYHVLGYAVPAFFVSIAVGLRIEQFGNYLFCWLSIHEPIIWSMFGPISLVSMLTIILFKLALCKSLPLNKLMSSQEADPNGLDLIRTHMLINSIKTPLIGLYWLVAVYAVNEALGTYAFVFPLAIVLKSILLFGLLCVVDKYIRYNLYVSWLRFKGEKVPFVDDSMMTQGPYGLAAASLGGGGAHTHQGSQQWMISMMNSMQPDGGQLQANYGLGGPFDMKNQAGQMLFPNQSRHPLQQQQQQQQQGGALVTPGFQSSCTDIFRPELLEGLSAASTTSRSTATGTSSSAAYREYKSRHSHHHHHHHKSRAYDELEAEGDELDDGGYGRSRRTHRRRHGPTGKSKSHRKHHHHSSSRHHHHHHHKHKISHHHQDDYELGGSAREHDDDEAAAGDYERHSRHHHHRERRAHRSGGGGGGHSNRHHSHHHHHQSQDSHHQRGANDGQHDSLDNILNNDQLLASSHSSDQEDVSSRSGAKYGQKRSVIYSAALRDQSETIARKSPSKEQSGASKDDHEKDGDERMPVKLNAQQAVTIIDQTVPMELLSPTQSTSGQQQQQSQDNELAKDNNKKPTESQS